jgi:hypothetical protein
MSITKAEALEILKATEHPKALEQVAALLAEKIKKLEEQKTEEIKKLKEKLKDTDKKITETKSEVKDEIKETKSELKGEVKEIKGKVEEMPTSDERAEKLSMKLAERITEVRKGKDGFNGKDGKDGKNGLDGRDGIDGKDGKDGKDGENGKDIELSILEETKKELKKEINEMKAEFGERLGRVGRASIPSGRVPLEISEAPSGTVNGTNDTFYLSATARPESLMLVWEGKIQRPGSSYEYVLTGKKIVFNAGSIPTAGALWARYTKF